MDLMEGKATDYKSSGEANRMVRAADTKHCVDFILKRLTPTIVPHRCKTCGVGSFNHPKEFKAHFSHTQYGGAHRHT